MTPDHLFTETATITARSETGSRDGYGNVLVATASRTTACWHEQTVRGEIIVGSDIAEETWNLYLPADDPLTSSDAVTINGLAFEVIGQPWQTWNPRAQTNGHVQVTIRRTDG